MPKCKKCNKKYKKNQIPSNYKYFVHVFCDSTLYIGGKTIFFNTLYDSAAKQL